MSFKSPFPDVEIPNLSVYDFLFGQVDTADGDRPALIDGASGAVTTYQSLVAQINGVAGALGARGLAVGEVVGLHSPNVPAFASVFHGILRAGGVATTINALYTAGPQDPVEHRRERGNVRRMQTHHLTDGETARGQRPGHPVDLGDERLVRGDRAGGTVDQRRPVPISRVDLAEKEIVDTEVRNLDVRKRALEAHWGLSLEVLQQW